MFKLTPPNDVFPAGTCMFPCGLSTSDIVPFKEITATIESHRFTQFDVSVEAYDAILPAGGDDYQACEVAQVVTETHGGGMKSTWTEQIYWHNIGYDVDSFEMRWLAKAAVRWRNCFLYCPDMSHEEAADYPLVLVITPNDDVYLYAGDKVLSERTGIKVYGGKEEVNAEG